LTDVYFPSGEPDIGDVLTYESGGWTSMPGGAVAHDVLSATHGDSTAASVVRGDIITGQAAAPNTKWKRLALGAAGTYLAGSATEPSWATLNAAAVSIPGGIGTPTYDDMQDFLNMTRSSGRLTGGVITAHDAGVDAKIDITALEGMIFTGTTLGSTLIYFKKAAQHEISPVGITDGAVNWIYIDYDTGNLTYKATTVRADINDYSMFAIGRIWISGNTIEILLTGHNLYNKDRRSHNRLIEKYGNMDRVSGATLSAHATALRLQTDAGSWYVANKAFTTPLANTFFVWYRHATGAWTRTSSLTLFSEAVVGGHLLYETYQVSTPGAEDLAELGAGRYGVYWVFMCPDGHLNIVMDGVNTGSIATAQAATVPAYLPPYCINWSRLIGRVICKKANATLYSVESSFAVSFTLSAAVDHSSLANLTAVDSHPQAAITGLTTGSSPTFAGLTLTAFSGVLWASGGVVYDGAILGDLDDVYFPSGEPDVGDVLTYQSGGWTSMPGGGSLALDDLTDVDAANPSDHDIIQYHTGTGWVHGALPAGGGGDNFLVVQVFS
jgi:hypothetical protein